jgi:L-malate glycosyltransferase
LVKNTLNSTETWFLKTDPMKTLVVSSNFPIEKNDVSSIFVYNEAHMLAQNEVKICVLRMPLKNFFSATAHNTTGGTPQVAVYETKLNFADMLSPFKTMVCLDIHNTLHPKDVAGVTFYASNIEKIARKNKVDLLHAHFAFIEGFASVIAKKHLKIPLILTLHGNDIVAIPAIKYGIRLQKRFDKIVNYTLKNADKVVVASKFMQEQAILAGCPPEKLVLIPHGIDTEKFNQNTAGSYVHQKMGAGKRPVIFSARCHKSQYGLEYLIKAASIVVKIRPDAVFIIGGNGPLKHAHEELAKKLGLKNNVFFPGEIPPDSIPNYYGLCDIFVIPSITESFGMVTIEAMACGKPVIGTNVGGIPEIIRDGVNGFLVPPRSPEDLAEKILFLLKNPALMEKMGNTNAVEAKEKYDLQVKAKKIMQLYNETLSQHNFE